MFQTWHDHIPVVESGSESPQIGSEGYLVGSGGWMPDPPSTPPCHGRFTFKFRLYRQKSVDFTLSYHTILDGLDGGSTPRKWFFGLLQIIDAHFGWSWTPRCGPFKCGENMKFSIKVILAFDMKVCVLGLPLCFLILSYLLFCLFKAMSRSQCEGSASICSYIFHSACP